MNVYSKTGNKIKSSILDDMEVSIIGSAVKPKSQNAQQNSGEGTSNINNDQTSVINDIFDEVTGNGALQHQTKQQSPYTKGTAKFTPESETNKLLQLSKTLNTLAQSKGVEDPLEYTPPRSFFTRLKDLRHDEYVELVAMTVFAGGFMFLFKAIINMCPCFIFIKSNPLKDAAYSLFREAVIIAMAGVILEGFNYYDILGTDDENIMTMSYALMMGILIWTLLGSALLIFAMYQIRKWKEYEMITRDFEQLEKLKNHYEKIYYRDQQLEAPEFETAFLDQVNYFLMRLEFIHPIFLPPLSEQFLRKDFDFSLYLAHAYGKTLTNFFNISWFTIVVLVTFLGLVRLAVSHSFTRSDPYGVPILDTITPLVFLIKFLIMYFHFRKIERKLYPHVRQSNGEYLKPEEINFHDNYDVVDPFTLYDNIPQPEYLDIQRSDDEESVKEYEGRGAEENEDEESSMIYNSASRRSDESQIRRELIQQWEQQENTNRQKESEYASVPNRHESLFVCGRSGITVTRIIFQVFYLASIIYLAAYIVVSAEKAYKDYDNKDDGTVIPITIVIILSPIILVVIWLVLLPAIMTKYTIITNIEMMKDREIIDIVVNEQKMERAQRSYRIYQVLKLIRREMAQELQQHIKDKRLRGFTKKQIIEQFEKLDGKKSKAVKGNAIKTLIRLCGQTLSVQEQNIMLKKAKSVSIYDKQIDQKGDMIRYKELSLAIEAIINDVKVDAYYLVMNLFQLFFRGEEKVEYNEFKTFFGEFVTYFDQEDIDAFLKEVQYIKRGSDEVYFQEVASLIRDDVELFPK